MIAHKLLKLEMKRLVDVGQHEDINEAELNYDSNDDDEINEYAIDENINNNNSENNDS